MKTSYDYKSLRHWWASMYVAKSLWPGDLGRGTVIRRLSVHIPLPTDDGELFQFLCSYTHWLVCSRGTWVKYTLPSVTSFREEAFLTSCRPYNVTSCRISDRSLLLIRRARGLRYAYGNWSRSVRSRVRWKGCGEDIASKPGLVFCIALCVDSGMDDVTG